MGRKGVWDPLSDGQRGVNPRCLITVEGFNFFANELFRYAHRFFLGGGVGAIPSAGKLIFS